MDPISHSDRVLALLRQRLKERSAATRKGAPFSASRRSEPGTVSGLAAVAILNGVDQHQLRRACVQALLTEQFGQHLINDSRFQQIVSRVTDVLTADARGTKLLDRVLTDLRGARA